MKGYYVIPKDDEPIEITGKNARGRAIKKAKDIYEKQHDDNIIVQQFDDENDNGYMDGLEYLTIAQIVNRLEI